MEVNLSAAGAVRDALVERVLVFARLLKAARLNVTPGRLIDVFRALQTIRLSDRDEFRLAMRTNLASSREEEAIFDRLFQSFWEARPETEFVPAEIDLEPRPDDRNDEYPETPPQLRGSPRQYSPDDLLRDQNLFAQWAGDSPDLQRALRELVVRLSTRPSRRFRPAAHGRRIDLRRSLRRNARYGMELVDLARTKRKIRKTRLVMLCDVSGSMDSYNPFLLQLMFGLQRQLRNSRTVVFSTRVTEITGALRHSSVVEILSEIAERVRHWSGGTDIGGALARLNRRVLREGPASSTVGVIVSDGYDQGDPRRVRREMEALRRHARVVVWINPLLGTEGYAPLAQGMQAALPFIDHFLPAHDVKSLRALCRTLGKV